MLLFPIRPVTVTLRHFAIASEYINKYASVDILGLFYQQLEVAKNILDKIVEEIESPLKVTAVKQIPFEE